MILKYNTAIIAKPYEYGVPENFAKGARAHVSQRGFLFAKRAVDVTFAIAFIPILAALTVVIFVANRFFGSGSVFFRQVRMGQDGKPFTMWKFRTMSDSGATLRAADAPLDEHRITTLGRLLRRTKLDEVPNFLNVLKGDMSLVGPRPDAFEHAEEYIGSVPHYRRRLAVRPGITGLAQVRGGYADNPRAVQRKVRYDRFYINNASFEHDMYVIALTFKVVLSGFGQR